MNIPVNTLSPQDSYKILTSLVVPRPIAWVTSQDERGVLNLAPFSYFNAVGNQPPVIVVSVGDEDGEPKHTAANIAATRDFVVNIVTEELLNAMNVSAADFPKGMSEVDAARLQTTPSRLIKTPRIAEAQAALECRLHSIQRIGVNNVILGEIVAFYVADRFIGERYHINGFAPIGRLGSPSTYCRTTDRFELPRMTYDQWKQNQ